MKHFISGLFTLVLLLSSNQASAQKLPPEIDATDANKITDIRPTTYFIPSEAKISCKGKYNDVPYSGKETQKLLTPAGKTIATVCKRFAAVLLMEGSAVLKDRGQGDFVVNNSGKVNGTARYQKLDRCKFGQGTKPDLCLLPYHTIAANNKIHKINEIIFVPAAQGIQLPDGSIHDGTFIVRDSGGAFRGASSQRVDLFVGTDPDYDNAFQRKGFDRQHPIKAFKIKGTSAERVRAKLREKFGELY